LATKGFSRTAVHVLSAPNSALVEPNPFTGHVNNDTLLHTAFLTLNREACTLLIERGAHLFQLSNTGHAPVHRLRDNLAREHIPQVITREDQLELRKVAKRVHHNFVHIVRGLYKWIQSPELYPPPQTLSEARRAIVFSNGDTPCTVKALYAWHSLPTEVLLLIAKHVMGLRFDQRAINLRVAHYAAIRRNAADAQHGFN